MPVSLLSELRRRNVIRVGIAYLAAVWAVLQVADVVLPSFDAPDWILQALVISAVLGFPVVALLAWFYDLVPDPGEAAGGSTDLEANRFLGRKLDFVIIALLILAVGFLFVTEKPDDLQEEVHSIAVLPFADMSASKDQAFFSDGVSEEIINLLAQVHGIRVVARTSAFSYKGTTKKIPEIAEELNVRYVLEGSVRRDQDDVRITAQLIEAESGFHVWSQSFDREMTDIFEIQDEVAAAIFDKLASEGGGVLPTRGRPTSNSDAYTLLLLARDQLRNLDALSALNTVSEAIAQDPEFAEAYQFRARLYWAYAGDVLDASDAQERMTEDARSALSYAPDLVLARALSKIGSGTDYSFLAELSAFEEAAVAEPNNPSILDPLILNLKKGGYLAEALTYSRHLVSVDPFSSMARGRFQSTLLACSRIDEASADIGGGIVRRIDSADSGKESSNANNARFDDDHWFIGEIELLNREYGNAERRFTQQIEKMNMESAGSWQLDTSWIAELVEFAREPESGQAYLDRRIPEIIVFEVAKASGSGATPASEAQQIERWLTVRLSRLYLLFGFLDRYYELILELGVSNTGWSDAEDLIQAGITYSAETGFTAHPKFPEIATALGMVDAWEQRGAPDFCEKIDGAWSCSVLRTPCAG